VLLSFGAAAATGDARAALVAAVLLADWLDGATARRHGARAHGQLVDVAADRISEVVLFASDPSALRLALFALAVGNLVLVAAARRRGRHLALPLRLGYLAVLALRR
jgi:phosphatidylglycerophosphate synthase